jgi:hypothetical protein
MVIRNAGVNVRSKKIQLHDFDLLTHCALVKSRRAVQYNFFEFSILEYKQHSK